MICCSAWALTVEVLDYHEFPCFSRLGYLITNVQNVSPQWPGNELFGCKNLRLPFYCIPMVSHQLFGDANHKNRKAVDLTFQILRRNSRGAPNQVTVT